NTLFELRSRLEEGLMSQLSDLTVNGEGPRIANTSNLSFEGVDGETLLLHLYMAGIAASHGSACASGALEPSRVLLEMGVSKVKARNSIRFSVSRFNTKEEIDHCINRTAELVKKLR
ncbi:MAG: aminotransferase class V-fold PLP-dependent enzyme, partial [Nitrosotalea sp.]